MSFEKTSIKFPISTGIYQCELRSSYGFSLRELSQIDSRRQF